LEKSNDISQIEKTCGYCREIGQLKDHCHWNLENPDNKLEEMKEVLVKEVCTQSSKGIGSYKGKQGNRNYERKTSLAIY
jgi:hypothetical protein